MTHSPSMLIELTRLCDGKHTHTHSVGGKAKRAENYPLDLVVAILRAIKRARQREYGLHSMEVEIHNDELELQPPASFEPDPEASSSPDDSRMFFDQYTGLPLPTDGVHAARK